MTRDEIDVAGLAEAYRRLVLWFGAQLVLNCGWMGFQPLVGESLVAAVLGLGVLAGVVATTCALAYYGYRTATALRSSVAWLWGSAMFVPFANVITLLVLSSKATRECRAKGIPVGFFGPKVPREGSAGRQGGAG